MNAIPILVLSIAISSTLQGQPPTPGAPTQHQVLRGVPLCFEENRGQYPDEVRFACRGAGYQLFLTDRGPVMMLRGAGTGSAARRQPTILRTELRGAVERPGARACDPLPGRVHHYRGRDRQRWATASLFRSVRYERVYPGIDVVYYGKQGELEYDFVVTPGAAPADIRLRFAGCEAIQIDAQSGDLCLTTPGGQLRHRAPFAYQEIDGQRRRVAARYHLNGDEVRFRVGDYDRDHELVIDPVLVYATYLGGNQADQDSRIAVDRDGQAVVTGWTFSTNFPVKNALSTSRQGSTDGFVTKFNKDGTGILWSTYLGGAGDDTPADIDVAADGSVAVCGSAASNDFPLKNPFQSAKPSAVAAFVTVFDKNGALKFSTLYGGVKSGTTRARGVVFDGNDVVIGGSTDAPDLPGTANGFQKVPAKFTDAFVARLSTSGGPSAVGAATYLGGSLVEMVWDVQIGTAGSICVVGDTTSTDLPVHNGYQSTHGGRHDAFATVFDSALKRMLYGTYVGGSADELQARVHLPAAIAVGPRGCLHLVGDTGSSDFLTTAGAYDRKQASSEGFVVKLDPTKVGSASLVFSTYFGGDTGDGLQSVDVDGAGNIFVGGFSNSRTDFPLKHEIQQPSPGTRIGFTDAVIAVLDPTGAKLLFSTALGGTNHEQCSGLALGSDGDVFVTGNVSGLFPATANAFQTTAPSSAVSVYVARLRVPIAEQANYGTGHPGTGGVPGLSLSDRPVLGANVSLTVGNSRGTATTGLLFLGLQKAAAPTTLGGTILVVPIVEQIAPIPAAGLTLPFTIPAVPANCGLDVFLQMLELDPGASAGLSFSRGLHLHIGV